MFASLPDVGACLDTARGYECLSRYGVLLLLFRSSCCMCFVHVRVAHVCFVPVCFVGCSQRGISVEVLEESHNMGTLTSMRKGVTS